LTDSQHNNELLKSQQLSDVEDTKQSKGESDKNLGKLDTTDINSRITKLQELMRRAKE